MTNTSVQRQGHRRTRAAITLAALLATTGALAQDTKAPDELAKFLAAYGAGSGLAYVVVKGKSGEEVYRYGDASREAVKRDDRGFMLFTCARPHVYLKQDPEARAALATARVVNKGDPEFAQLDRKYLAGCRNPLVRSALPAKK